MADARDLPACPAALLERDAAQHRSPHQQRLMQDQHEGGRHDVARVGGGRVEQRHLHQLDRLNQVATPPARRRPRTARHASAYPPHTPAPTPVSPAAIG